MTTFAVVHGAGGCAWEWHLVAARLRHDGHEVVAVDLPCEDDTAGLTDYAATVVQAVDPREDVVVVGHSLGGFTAPIVAARLGAARIVLVTAMIPEPGERAGEWWANTGYPADVGDFDERESFYNAVPDELVREAQRRGRDQSATPMTEPWPLERWPNVPVGFVLCRDDRFHPAGWMRGVVRDRLGIEPVEVDGGHCAYLSHPNQLAEALSAVDSPE